MKYLTGGLLLSIILLLIAIFNLPDDKFHIIACDIGQGDAILITYQNFQILTDGGPLSDKILSCLSRHLPFWDKEIEVVILTNPDIDHYGGLINVFKNYNVRYYFNSKLSDSTQGYKLLENVLGSSRVKQFNPVAGTTIRHGLMSLDIIYPDDSMDSSAKDAQNNNSTVSTVNFGNFKALLTGDAEEEASDYIARNLNLGTVNYLKVNHHGSKNGLTQTLLEVSQPQIAVISVGKDNKYGHPHQEILDMLKNFGVKYYRTDEKGDVEVVTDGKRWWMK